MPTARQLGEPATVLTVGHSTRPIGDMLELLRAHRVEELVDVRTIPRSRHNPQYNLEALPGALAAAGIAYRHLPTLGGLRRPRPDSPNGAWRNASFRGFADYMQTAEFDQALDGLLELAGCRRVAVMCAEAVPWRCHRSLIADALAARGARVEHLMSATSSRPHRLAPLAKVEGGGVTYPPEQGLFAAL